MVCPWSNLPTPPALKRAPGEYVKGIAWPRFRKAPVAPQNDTPKPIPSRPPTRRSPWGGRAWDLITFPALKTTPGESDKGIAWPRVTHTLPTYNGPGAIKMGCVTPVLPDLTYSGPRLEGVEECRSDRTRFMFVTGPQGPPGLGTAPWVSLCSLRQPGPTRF